MLQRRPSVLEAAFLLHVTEEALCFRGSLSPTCYRGGPSVLEAAFLLHVTEEALWFKRQPFSDMFTEEALCLRGSLFPTCYRGGPLFKRQPFFRHVTEEALCLRGSLTTRSSTCYRQGRTNAKLLNHKTRCIRTESAHFVFLKTTASLA